MIKQSFTWWSFADVTNPEELLKQAAKIGYAGVELIDEALFPPAKKHGLAISAHRAHGTIEQGLNNRDNHARILKELEQTLELAERWKIPNLICFSGNREGLSDAEGAEITAEGLSKVAPLAEAAGVTLVLELLNSKVDHPGYQCDYTSWGVSVVEKVASPRVKLLYDVYHMQIMEGDLIRTIQNQHKHFGHYHTAGNPGRHEINDQQEIFYPPIFKAIKDTGYSGYIAHEFLPTKDTVVALKEAFDLCKQSLA
jgi:hydroxypyruvate isomerase